MAKKTETQKAVDKLQAEIDKLQKQIDKAQAESGRAPAQLQEQLSGLKAGLAHAQEQAE